MTPNKSLRPRTLAPTGSSPEALKSHAEGIAEVLRLDQAQTDILVSEIRNALCPALLTAQTYDPQNPPDAEEIADFKVSIDRVLALMTAFDRAVR
jgi:hypothetical protein